MKSKQIQLKKRPVGMPSLDDFQTKEVEIGEVSDGEFAVTNEWFSVDPYMRGRMKDTESYVPPFALDETMEGGCVGKVVVSKNEDFPEGTWVLGNSGWRDNWISDGGGVVSIDTDRAPASAYLGVLGLTGMTAFVGLTEIASLEDGNTVFVSAASGAVGSIVAQIAKLHSCQVVGSAGSADKIAWLKEKAGIDTVFNYHDVDDVSTKLKELCPDGIDIYFDNVGGDHLQGAIDNMNNGGRIACCGMISGYNDEEPKPGPDNLFKIIGKRIRMQGFIVRDHMDLQDKFIGKMIQWINEGKIHWEETITEGVENAPEAFIGLFQGDKLGKALVKVHTR